MSMTVEDDLYLEVGGFDDEFEVDGTPISQDDVEQPDDYEFEDMLYELDEGDSIFDKIVSPLTNLIDEPSRFQDEYELEGSGDSMVMLAGAYESKLRKMKTAARIKAVILALGIGGLGYIIAKKNLLSGRGRL